MKSRKLIFSYKLYGTLLGVCEDLLASAYFGVFRNYGPKVPHGPFYEIMQIASCHNSSVVGVPPECSGILVPYGAF